MKYRLQTMSGWWKGRNQFGIPMAGPDRGDVLEFDTKDDALAEMRNIPAIVGFDGIVPVTRAQKKSADGAKTANNKHKALLAKAKC